MYKRQVQRGHYYAIVDEVDSILIDEARTPLIISGAGTQAAETYNKFARIMPRLRLDEDYDMDEAKKTINATESGLEKIEAMLGIDDLYADPSGQLANHLQQALKAEFLFHRDVAYVCLLYTSSASRTHPRAFTATSAAATTSPARRQAHPNPDFMARAS